MSSLSLKSPSPLCTPKLDEIYLRSADSRRSSGSQSPLREPPSPLPMASPRPGASLATADRRGVHALERLGEALDAALSTGVAFVLLLWAKPSVFYEVLIRVVRLLLFVALLIPGWIPATAHYLYGAGVSRGVRYGPSSRHKLDVYSPVAAVHPPPPDGFPTVLFVCGGAWMIGYRMWAFLFGWVLQRNGVLCLAIDYRNWPQATMPEMVADVERALRWAQANAASLGGDVHGRVRRS